jgi:predicted Zn finger-like uncharacterized protein
MILTCPSCGTQYAVKDGAIPPEGRQVRCAACKHSWHQGPEEMTPAAADPEAPADAVADVQPESAQAGATTAEPAQTDEDGSLAEATLIEPRSGPEAEERAYEEAVIDRAAGEPVETAADEEGAAAAPVYEAPATAVDADELDEAPFAAADWREPPTPEPVSDTFSPFAEQFEEESRRGALRGILLALLLLVAAAALFWFFAPDELKAKLGIAQGAPTPLQVVVTHQERRKLESGNELLTITGRVINPSPKEQDVPPIQAQLKDGSGKVVYSWTIQPDTRSLAGGASASFNSAEVNVPAGGNQLAITLGTSSA